MIDHALVAFNTATASANKIHADDVASKFGFEGGLVPGVDVYAYLTHPVVEAWGVEWLSSGVMTARFHSPVYDGRTVTVVVESASDATASLAVIDDAGRRCAEATAGWAAHDATAFDPIPEAPMPADRPPASPESLVAGQVMGTLSAGFHADKHAAYLSDISDSLDVYPSRGIAHPGWLLRWANWSLADNVKLGPWIHVESTVTHRRPLHDGERLECRGRVREEWEHKGHRFVRLDVLLSTGAERVAEIEHVAIYRPRQVTQA